MKLFLKNYNFARYILFDMNLIEKDKYALVTGGSSGMGLEYVRQLASIGYNVIIVALYQTETDIVKDEMSIKYPNLDFVSIGMDLSHPDSAKVLYEKICEILPNATVEVLINNAGILNPIHFRNMTEAQISRIILIHNHTLALLCHYFVKQMAANGRGYILNVSSLAAWLAFPFISTYSATKAFTRVFTKSLRIEYKGSGVKFSTIYFGAVDTNLYNLSPGLRKLAHCVGVMISAEKAAKRALRMMFKGHSGYMPGFINKLTMFISPLLSRVPISFIEKKVTKRWNLK